MSKVHKENICYRVINEYNGKTILKPTINRSKAFRFAREWNKEHKLLNEKSAYVYKEWTEGRGKYKQKYGEALN